MFQASEIENALRVILSPSLQGHASSFAEILANAANGKTSQEIAGKQLSSNEAFIAILKEMSGRKITTSNTLINFGDKNRFGDVNIRDVAGGDIIHITINSASLAPLNYYWIVASAIIIGVFIILGALIVRKPPQVVSGNTVATIIVEPTETEIKSPSPTVVNSTIIPTIMSDSVVTKIVGRWEHIENSDVWYRFYENGTWIGTINYLETGEGAYSLSDNGDILSIAIDGAEGTIEYSLAINGDRMVWISAGGYVLTFERVQ